MEQNHTENLLSTGESVPDESSPVELTQADEVKPAEHDIISFSESTDVLAPQPLPSGLVIPEDSGSFVKWMLDHTVPFLDLADLPALDTVDRLRGQKEQQIRDKIQFANSTLVLLANYGSDTDNQSLVDACTEYAQKMQIIIKRLCL